MFIIKKTCMITISLGGPCYVESNRIIV